MTDSFQLKAPFLHVIVATDGSELAGIALAGGATLAARTQAELHVFHAASDTAGKAVAIRQAADLLKDKPYKLIIRDVPSGGSTVNEIGSYATEVGNAVVAIGTHGRGGMGTTLLGSTAVDLVGQPDRPIMAYGPGAGAPTAIERIVACVDGSEFSELSISEGARWAVALQAHLWVVQVVAPDLPPFVTAFESTYVHNLSRELDGFGIKVDWDVLHSLNPARSIIEGFGEDAATMVVIATHGRRGLKRVLLGSVATDVVKEAWGPVALIRPNEDPRD